MTQYQIQECIEQHLVNSTNPIWKELKDTGTVKKIDEDANTRPTFVRIQAAFEICVSNLKNIIKQATCVIHTPCPPTPLRSLPDIKSDQCSYIPAINEIKEDTARCNSVLDRQVSLSKFLEANHKLVCIYEKTNCEGMDIYREFAETHSNLEDHPINTKIPLIGATCIAVFNDDTIFEYGILGSQANAPEKSFESWIKTDTTEMSPSPSISFYQILASH